MSEKSPARVALGVEGGGEIGGESDFVHWDEG